MAGIAQAQPNIALIKYWGKRDTALNLPATGSLSVTLDSLWTRTRVEFDASLKRDELRLNDMPAPAALARVSACLDSLRALAGVETCARIESYNNFPTAAGLASSASGFAALVVAASAALDLRLNRRILSSLARRGSGSAARSLFGGYVLLTTHRSGSGLDATPRSLLPGKDWPLEMVIAVTSRSAKPVSSRAGMEISRRTSPFYNEWVANSDADLAIAQAAVLAHDFAALAAVSEHNCLKMHAVMMSSRPALMYWNAATLECMHRIRDLRERDGVRTFFTIDAGPQVKAVCVSEDAERVAKALADVPGVATILRSRLGEGARLLRESEREVA